MEQIPEFLYHYTNVQALALILQNQKIKFSPLTTLDDMQEEQILDDAYYSRFVYVSSWTDEQNESIPMWNMYASMDSGIRIKLPTLPFHEYTVQEELAKQSPSDSTLPQDAAFKPIIPNDELQKNPFQIMPYTKNGLLKKVKYTNDGSLLKPKIFCQEEGSRNSIDFSQLGQHKSTSWAFQKEWRYWFYLCPLSRQEILASIQGNGYFHIAMQRYADKSYPIPPTYFLKIDENAFRNMEIILSPKLSKGNEVIVNALKEKFNPSMSVLESALRHTIR